MIKSMIYIAVTVIAALMLLWFLSPIIYGVHNIGTLFGVLICGALIFRFGFHTVYENLKLRLCEHTATAVMLRIVQVGAIAFLLYAVVISAFMVYAMNVKPSADSTAVVLGAQVKPWGPSTLLRQRIDAAQIYLETDPEASAVLTGGQGDDEVMSEAQCMFENLTAAGIDESRLYREDQATNTEENIRYSLKIIQDNGLKSDIAIITDSYHQLRARIIAAKTDSSVKAGAVNTRNNIIGLSAYPAYFVREWIAIPVEILK